MTNIRYLLFCLVFLAGLANCAAQSSSTSFHSHVFGWTIEVPAGFEKISDEENQRLRSKGIDAIEDTYGDKVEDQTTSLFTFRQGSFNYMEANYQSFNPADGTYDEQRMGVQEVIYETFRDQLPAAKIDTASSVQVISKLSFYVFEVRLVLPNDMVMTIHMYSRLFGNKEFSLNIAYVDQKEGELMLDAWRKSTFE